jgi:hypothetical protein
MSCTDNSSPIENNIYYLGSYEYRHCGIFDPERLPCGYAVNPSFISNKLKIYHINCSPCYGDNPICKNKKYPVFVSSSELDKTYYAPTLANFLALDTLFPYYAYEGKPIFFEDWFAYNYDIDLVSLQRLLRTELLVELNCKENECPLEKWWNLTKYKAKYIGERTLKDGTIIYMNCDEYENSIRELLRTKNEAAERVILSSNLFSKETESLSTTYSTFIFIYGKNSYRKPEIVQIRNWCATENINAIFTDNVPPKLIDE